MNTYRKTVEIGLDDANKHYDVAALNAAAADGKPVGHLNVTVGYYPATAKSEAYYALIGDAMAMLPSDNVTEVNKRLALDLGTVDRVDGDDAKRGLVYRGGQAITIDYVLNHQGLPLHYNKAIRDCFRKQAKARVSAETAMSEAMAATVWLSQNNPAMFAEACGGKLSSTAVVDYWKQHR